MISVIMAVYNSKEFVETAIRSVISQSYTNIELLIGDDGSTDGTLAILREYKHHPQIRLFELSHCGNVGLIRNELISCSLGDKIAFIDADDEWLREKLEVQVQYLSTNDLVCSNAILIDENNSVIQDRYFVLNKVIQLLDLPDLLKNNYVVTSSVLVKKKCFLQSGGFECEVGIRGEDYILWLEICKNANIYFIDTPLIRYRKHSKNLSFLSNFERIELLKRTIRIRANYIASSSKLISEAAKIGLAIIYQELAKIYFRIGHFDESLNAINSFQNYFVGKFSFQLLKFKILKFYIILLSKLTGGKGK